MQGNTLRAAGPGSTEKGFLALLALLSFGHLATDIVQGALPALLPYLKDRYSLSYATTGSILMAAHIASSGIQPVFGYLTDRRPMPILMPAGLLLSGVGVALIPYASNFGWLVTLVILLGIGTATFHPEGFKATACIARASRATGMSFFSVGGNLGFAIGGPAAIFLVSRLGLWGASALMVPCLLATALLIPVLPTIRKSIAVAQAGSAQKSGAGRPVYAIVLITLIVVFRTWTQLGLAAFLPFLYRAELDQNPDFVATLLFVFLGSGTVGTLAGGPLGDRIGHRKMLFASLALQVPLVYLFLASKGWLLYVLASLMGATIVSTFSVTIVMAQELFPGRMAMASGIIAGFAIGTGGLGVTLLGMVADRWGLGTAVHLIGCLPAAGAVLACLLPLPWREDKGRPAEAAG